MEMIIRGVKYPFNMSFLTHRLCHIFQSVLVTFQNGFVPKTSSSSPDQTALPEAPQSSVANTAALLLEHLMLSKRGPHHNSNHFHPDMWHVAVSSRRMHKHTRNRSTLTHCTPSHGSIWQLRTNSKTTALVLQREWHLPVCRPGSSSTL